MRAVLLLIASSAVLMSIFGRELKYGPDPLDVFGLPQPVRPLAAPLRA